MVEFAPVGDNLLSARVRRRHAQHLLAHRQDRSPGHAQGRLFHPRGDGCVFDRIPRVSCSEAGSKSNCVARDAGTVDRSLCHQPYWRRAEFQLLARVLGGAAACRRFRRLCATAMTGVGLIHISGITLAIIGDQGRRNLLKALDAARSQGSIVSYDPNARPRLWRDTAEMQQALREALEVTDIALPSFDDEAMLWGDANPEATAKRIAAAGVREIAVKNGHGAIALFNAGRVTHIPTPEVGDIRDTTGAGDAFNAGYLAGRLVGMAPTTACQLGQELAGEIISHFGALAPESTLERFRSGIRDYVLRRLNLQHGDCRCSRA